VKYLKRGTGIHEVKQSTINKAKTNFAMSSRPLANREFHRAQMFRSDVEDRVIASAYRRATLGGVGAGRSGVCTGGL